MRRSDPPKDWDDARVMAELRGNTPLNVVRKAFSTWCARLDQECQQDPRPNPIELRRLEFEAAADILDAYESP